MQHFGSLQSLIKGQDNLKCHFKIDNYVSLICTLRMCTGWMGDLWLICSLKIGDLSLY